MAAFTAAAALDVATPRFLRVAGDSVSARQLAEVMSDVSGEHYRTLRVGGMTTLDVMIRIAKLVASQSEAVFPPWQGMQYMRDMFSGRATLARLDNARYPEIQWTRVRQHLAARLGAAAPGASTTVVPLGARG